MLQKKKKKKKRKIKGDRERERNGNGFLVIIQYVFEFPFLLPIWFLLVVLEKSVLPAEQLEAKFGGLQA